MSILDNFKNERHIVGVSLTPGVGLEAVVLEKSKRQVAKYAKRDVQYNFSTREIQNMAQFKAKFSELMEELGVPQKAEINVVLPNVLFDFIEAPPEITDVEDVKTMILTKAEEFYLFKRDEPVSGFCEVVNYDGGTQKKYAYTSFQKNIVDQIKGDIDDLGYNVVGIESSYSATLRGLYVAGLIDDVVLESAAWSLMLVSSNSYTLFQMEGKNIVNYNDVPLAIKSFSIDEAYQTIIQGASQILKGYITNKLFIASQTDEISAEYLKNHMQFDRDIVVIESNKFSQQPLMEVTGSFDTKSVNAMTLTSVGAASGRVDFKFTLNVLEGDPSIKSDIYRIKLSGKEYEVSGAQVSAISILISAIIGVIGLAIILIVFSYGSMTDKKIAKLSADITDIDNQIAELSKVEEKKEEVDIESVIDEIAEQNVEAINFYDSISTDIPKNVWLTKYYNKLGRDIAIRGIAENIIDIYEYYKNLRIVSPQSDIKLTELRVVTSDSKTEDQDKFISSLNINQDKDRLYSFEISNTQIQLPAKPEEGSEIDENDLLRQAPPSLNVEETSTQMTPAQ